MSEAVKRYWLESFIDDFYKARQFVLAADHDRIVAELQAQVEQLKQDVAALRQHKNDYMDAAEETQKALRAEVEQLRKDAALFRRLRDLPDELLGAPGVPCVAIPEGQRAGRYVSGPDLDAAMEASR